MSGAEPHPPFPSLHPSFPLSLSSSGLTQSSAGPRCWPEAGHDIISLVCGSQSNPRLTRLCTADETSRSEFRAARRLVSIRRFIPVTQPNGMLALRRHLVATEGLMQPPAHQEWSFPACSMGFITCSLLLSCSVAVLFLTCVVYSLGAELQPGRAA